MTLGTAIDNYIKVNDSVLSPSTINAYKSYRKTRFKAFIDLDVGKINYQQMVNEEARNYAPKTVHNAWRLVTAARSNLAVAKYVVYNTLFHIKTHTITAKLLQKLCRLFRQNLSPCKIPRNAVHDKPRISLEVFHCRLGLVLESSVHIATVVSSCG